ncbi:hypothetical protein ASD64_19995 [Mesorhizobium sp. Root157]|nr:hypothetical protein ASD64_19995 [Mesorhizobium sp. Root157]
MRLIRLYIAIAMLLTSRLLTIAGGRIVEAEATTWVAEKPKLLAGPLPTHENGSQSDPLRPVEQMLLGSIVGLAICFLWIWISARAGI